MPSIFERKKLAFAISIALSASPLLLADDVVSESDIDQSNPQSQETVDDSLFSKPPIGNSAFESWSCVI